MDKEIITPYIYGCRISDFEKYDKPFIVLDGKIRYVGNPDVEFSSDTKLTKEELFARLEGTNFVSYYGELKSSEEGEISIGFAKHIQKNRWLECDYNRNKLTRITKFGMRNNEFETTTYSDLFEEYTNLQSIKHDICHEK